MHLRLDRQIIITDSRNNNCDKKKKSFSERKFHFQERVRHATYTSPQFGALELDNDSRINNRKQLEIYLHSSCFELPTRYI